MARPSREMARKAPGLVGVSFHWNFLPKGETFPDLGESKQKTHQRVFNFMNSVDNGWNYGSWLLKGHLKWRYRIYQSSKILYNIYTYNILRKYSEPSSLTLHQSWRPDFGPLSHLRYRPTSRWNPTAPPRHSCHHPTCYSPTWWLDHHGAVQPRHLQWPGGYWTIKDLTREAGENQDMFKYFAALFSHWILDKTELPRYSPFLQWRNQASHLETVKPWPFPPKRKKGHKWIIQVTHSWRTSLSSSNTTFSGIKRGWPQTTTWPSIRAAQAPLQATTCCSSRKCRGTPRELSPHTATRPSPRTRKKAGHVLPAKICAALMLAIKRSPSFNDSFSNKLASKRILSSRQSGLKEKRCVKNGGRFHVPAWDEFGRILKFKVYKFLQFFTLQASIESNVPYKILRTKPQLTQQQIRFPQLLYINIPSSP